MKRGILCVVFSFFLLMTISGYGWSSDEERAKAFSNDYRYVHTIMKPDGATLMKWMEARKNAPRAFIDEKLMTKIPLKGSLNLLSHLVYTASERQQGYCGNCWTWSGTGIVEIARSVQSGIKERLSIQYINSCRTTDYACCGGLLSEYASFYSARGQVIPWSNTNASFQDASKYCEDGSSDVLCSSISTVPSYNIPTITHEKIITQGVGQSTAIANIKNVLHQNRGVEFGFYLATQSDWDNYYNFWDNQGENAIWNPDFSCGHSWVSEEGGGHATLIVGYNDDDDANPYWIVLNSWGTANGNRPNGLFRLAMNMNYDCNFYYPDDGKNYYSFDFETLTVEFTGGSNTTTTPGSSTTTTIGGGCPPEYPIDCYGDATKCCLQDYPICCDGNEYCCPINYPVCGEGIDEGYCFTCPAGITLENDEAKLGVLREMRDSRMASSGLGASLIELYYEHADEISNVLLADEWLQIIAASVVGEIVEKSIALNNDEDVSMNQELIDGILEMADLINASASPSLKEAIKKVKKEIKRGDIFRQLGIQAVKGYR